LLFIAPVIAFLLTFLGWDSFCLPVELDRFLLIALAVAALACAHPLRKTLARAQPLGWGGKLFVFTFVLLLWFTSLAPLLVILNVKLDQSTPEHLERTVLEARARGASVCVVKVSEWKNGGDEHWLWIDCEHPEKLEPGKSKVRYDLRRGGFGFAWVSSNKSGM
jgi:hypothetical protein